jgi:hypothetical protein
MEFDPDALPPFDGPPPEDVPAPDAGVEDAPAGA